MKKLLTFIAFLISQSAFAGPFVSGGMPGAVGCQDSQGRYQMKFIYLGPTVGLTGTRNGSEPLDYQCQGVYESLPSQMDTQLYFACQSETSSDSIKIFRQTGTNRLSGLLVTKTRNGVPNPIGLECKFVQL